MDQDTPRGRAQRRHDRARIREHRKNLNKNRWRLAMEETPSPRWIGKMTQTGTPCSCWMCGNPRHKHNEVTFAERRIALTEKEGRRGADSED